MKKTLIIAGLFLGFSSSVFAAVTAQAKVTKLMTYPGVTIIKISSKAYSCSFPNKNYLYLDTTSTNGRAVYSAALTAFTTNTKVQIAYTGCKGWWGKSLPKMYRIDLVK